MSPKYLLPLVAAAMMSTSAIAQSQGDWIVRAGIGFINTDTDSGDLVFEGTRLENFQVNVDNNARPVVNLTWMATDNVGLEVLAAWPFRHNIDGRGALEPIGRLGSTKHLPPTVSLQYHFRPNQTVRPYAGIGLNYTWFFDQSTTDGLHDGIIATANAATGSDFTGGQTSLNIKDSFGIALQFGLDIDLTRNTFLNFDLRWIDIEADARLRTRTEDGQGNPVELRSRIKADIDPWVFTTAIGFRF